VRIVTVSGPPSSGKTSVILKAIEYLKKSDFKIGVVKFDGLSTYDDRLYKAIGVEVIVGLSGNICPDHYYMTNIEDCVDWGLNEKLDLLIIESAGLCNRCSPHIKDVLSICVVDNLSGINTPQKIGPMLKLADLVVITKGDIVSQSEREVFAFRVKQSNPRCSVIFVNGITGQGAADLGLRVAKANRFKSIKGKKLRFSMPVAVCSYCTGETRIGEEYQTGNIKKIKI